MQIKMKDLTPEQKEVIGLSISQLLQTVCQACPPITPHLLSGGTIRFDTMSGAQLTLAFASQSGGIIMPGGIRPAGQTGRIIQ